MDNEINRELKAGPRDLQETQKIERMLRDELDYFESDQQRKHKEEVLGKLGLIIQKWTTQMAIKHNFPEELADKIESKLFTFGSYRLNVNSNESDIGTFKVVGSNP